MDGQRSGAGETLGIRRLDVIDPNRPRPPQRPSCRRRVMAYVRACTSCATALFTASPPHGTTNGRQRLFPEPSTTWFSGNVFGGTNALQRASTRFCGEIVGRIVGLVLADSATRTRVSFDRSSAPSEFEWFPNTVPLTVVAMAVRRSNGIFHAYCILS